MDEPLKNQVIDTSEYMYLKEFNNKYTVFLGDTCRDLLEHLLDRYGNITIADLEFNNQWMNELIDLSLPIDKYFDWIDECVQFENDGKTPYTASQFIQKAHHAVLETAIYVDACKEWRKNPTSKKTWIGLNKFFADE